jgi:hypothetical protein
MSWLDNLKKGDTYVFTDKEPVWLISFNDRHHKRGLWMEYKIQAEKQAALLFADYLYQQEYGCRPSTSRIYVYHNNQPVEVPLP